MARSGLDLPFGIMRTHCRNLVTLLLAANYVLAVTASGLLHDHDPLRPSPGSAAGPPDLHRTGCCPLAGDPHAACLPGSTAADHLSGQVPAGEQPAKQPTSQKCPVCQFLAQKPVPAQQLPAVVPAGLAQQAPIPGPIPAARDLPSTRLIRGPPPLG